MSDIQIKSLLITY